MTHIADIRYQGELHNELQHLPSKRIIHTDAPTDNQGKGEAFSPTDLLASALAACVMTMMGMKAKSIGIELTGAHAQISKEMAANPRRISAIRLQIYLPANLDGDTREILEQTALHCPVAYSLSSELTQDMQFHYTL